jgi:hypothetical protein
MRGLLVFVLLGCSHKAAAPSEPTRLYNEAELAQAKAEVLKRAAANATRTCPRPVLEGKPTPGPATADMIAIFEPTGALAACEAQLAENLNELQAQFATRTPAVLALEHSCGPQLEAAVRAAIGHEDSCWPYQIGVHPLPEHIASPFGIVHLLDLRADLAAEHDLAGALALELATLRFAHDLGRGHQGVLGLLYGALTSELTIDNVRAMLEDRHPTATELDALAPHLDALLATEPSFTDGLEAESEQTALYVGMALLEPATWIPPGGWPPGQERPDPKLIPGLELHDAAGLVMASLDNPTIAACPRAASLLACFQGLSSPADSVELPNVPGLLASLRQQGTTDPVKLRAIVAERLANVTAWSGYANKLARSVALLAALRIHVEILRTVARTGHCPDAAALDRSPFAELATPATLGASLTLAVSGPAIELGLPMFVDAKGRSTWRVSCPP